MTKIKLCGLSRRCDIDAANALMPDYVGFVFAEGSKRRVTPAQAQALKNALSPRILAVGVFVGEAPATVAALLGGGIIDAAQLHGGEDAAYIRALRRMTDRPIWQAFRVRTRADVEQAGRSEADCILLDAGAGTGTAFDWGLLDRVERPYFLAGGLDTENVAGAIRLLRPFGVDVSSGIESGGGKDAEKMAAFVAAVRRENV